MYSHHKINLNYTKVLWVDNIFDGMYFKSSLNLSINFLPQFVHELTALTSNLDYVFFKYARTSFIHSLIHPHIFSSSQYFNTFNNINDFSLTDVQPYLRIFIMQVAQVIPLPFCHLSWSQYQSRLEWTTWTLVVEQVF